MAGFRKHPDSVDVEWCGRIYRRHPNHENGSMRRYFMATTHPRSYLHRDIYEDKNGRIPDGWEVHHIDENSLNNDPENLVALSPTDHAKIHCRKPRDIEVECHQCGEHFFASFSRAKWCSAACKEKSRRKAGTAYVRPKIGSFSENRKCENCGSDFVAKKRWGRFCSAACRGESGRNRRKS